MKHFCLSRFSTVGLLILSAPALTLPAPAQTDLPTLKNPTLSLAKALKVASQNSVTLHQRQADADAASAEARGAQAQRRPSLSATTFAATGDSANILTSSPGISPQNFFTVTPRPFADQNIMLMVPLLTGGRLENAAAGAGKLEQAAALAVQASRLTVAASVIEDYANAALQQSLVNVAQARETAETEQVRVTEEKVTTGRSAPVDLLREQAELADAGQALLAAQNSVALALIRLKTELGISQNSQIALADTLESLSSTVPIPATLQEVLHQADTNRPELAAMQQRVEAAQSAVRAAQGQYTPQVYGVAMADASAGQNQGRAGYTVGLTASLPLIDGGQRRSDVDGANARLARAQADAQQVRQQVDQETAAAWINAQTSAAQVKSAAAGVTAAQEGYALATLRYNAGKSVAAERLDSLAALVRAQGALAQAQANVIVDRAKLQAALGLP